MDELENIRKQRLEEMMKGLEKKDFPNSPVHVTDGNFNEIVSKYPLTVVDCWAQWCGPCKRLGPTIDALAKEYQGQIVFGKLNVDENPATAKNYGISGIPAMLVFKDGNFAGQIVGALPKEQIIKRLKILM